MKFIQRNFYVDDALASVDTEAEAIQLVKEARDLCNTGKLHLHIFITCTYSFMNSKNHHNPEIRMH